MNKYTVHLLGPAQAAWQDGESPRFRSQRTMAILGYLAVEQRPVARDALAALFWPDEAQSTGKANLRRELHNLGNILPGCWQTDRQTVVFMPGAETRVDVHELLRLEEAGQWLAAAELVRGDFLEGVRLEENLEFETWLLGERERWRQHAERLLSRAVEEQARAGRDAEALRLARQLLQLMPWHEETHRRVMILLAQQGQRSAALRQYEQCRALLQEMLGVDVSDDTRAVYERIRDPAPFALHNIPAPTTPLIGREKELGLLNRWLADDDVRLITIMGPGGMGKTRLMLALAQELLERADRPFTDGVYLVNLTSLDGVEQLISQIGIVLKFPLHGQDRRSPRQRLLDYLTGKQMLLLFDSVEHLLSGAGLATEILRAAPGVQIVATSRRRLGLRGEQLLPLNGLPYEQVDVSAPDAVANDAARLFLRAAIRMEPALELSDNEEYVNLYHICRLVEGMPLALELAATWTESLSLAAIAREIAQGLGFLETDVRDVPARHRSIHAVFDASWQRLLPRDRRAFARLSVFRGRFSRKAAEAVSGASMKGLSRLVNRSLLQKAPEGCYYMHELLKQYAAEKLRQNAEETRATEARFATFYLDFLEQRRESLHGPQQRETVAEISTELDNVRAAWGWALAQQRGKELQRTVTVYVNYHFYQSRFREAATAAARAAAVFAEMPPSKERDLARAEALNRLAWCQIRLGHIAQAQAAAEDSFDTYSRLDRPPPPGYGTDSALPLAIVALVQGAPERAVELAERARAGAEGRDDGLNLGLAHYVLSSAHAAVGRYEAAYREAQRSCTIARGEGHEWFLGYTLLEVGKAAQATGRYAEAKYYYEASIPIRRRFNDKGEAEALSLLGEIALLEDDCAAARRFFEEALAIYQDTNDRGSMAGACLGLGQVAFAEREYDLARRHLEKAMTIAADIQFWPLVLKIFVDIGRLFLETGATSAGVEALAQAKHHDAAKHETRTRATEELAAWRPRVDARLFSASVTRGKERALETALMSLRRMLSSPLGFDEGNSSP